MSFYWKRCLCLIYLMGHTLLCAGVNKEPNEWEPYFQYTLNLTEPHTSLNYVLKYFEHEGNLSNKALDLGAGTGRDTLTLLQKGWIVHAVDGEQVAIDILLKRVAKEHLDRLSVMHSSFADMQLSEQYDLINASLCLPYCQPKDFPECWEKIVEHLAVGGRFAGHFFGDKDELAGDKTKTIHTQEQVLALFKDRFEIEYLQIEIGLKPCLDGSLKHWHMFHVIARKIN